MLKNNFKKGSWYEKIGMSVDSDSETFTVQTCNFWKYMQVHYKEWSFANRPTDDLPGRTKEIQP